MKKKHETNATHRRDFLQLAGITLGGAAAMYLLRGDLAAIANAIQRAATQNDTVDVVSAGEAAQAIEVVPEATPGQALSQPGSLATSEPQVQQLEPSDIRARGYNLWDTINLASSNEKPRFCITLMVVDNTGRVTVGSNAWPMGYSAAAYKQFENSSSFRTLTYIPSGQAFYPYNPHTWVHSGNYEKHRFFAGKFEEALRLTPERGARTTAQTMADAEINFRDATAYLLQAPYEDTLLIFRDVTPTNIQSLLGKFPGNVLSMRIASGIRVPPSLLEEYRGSSVTADPLPWMQANAQKTLGETGERSAEGKPLPLGWGWDDVLTKSRWYMSFCSGSTADERQANNNEFHIDSGQWAFGLDLVDRVSNFDPFF